MNKLNRAVDRFAYSHPNFGISNLMRIVLGGQLLKKYVAEKCAVEDVVCS